MASPVLDSGPRFLNFAGPGPVQSQNQTARSMPNRFWPVDPLIRHDFDSKNFQNILTNVEIKIF